jgi:hypothetical protein
VAEILFTTMRFFICVFCMHVTVELIELCLDTPSISQKKCSFGFKTLSHKSVHLAYNSETNLIQATQIVFL